MTRHNASGERKPPFFCNPYLLPSSYHDQVESSFSLSSLSPFQLRPRPTLRHRSQKSRRPLASTVDIGRELQRHLGRRRVFQFPEFYST